MPGALRTAGVGRPVTPDAVDVGVSEERDDTLHTVAGELLGQVRF
ncbi:hypothetical protein [Amycolatopsis sp. WQ 127309]|nr:hypothetical protein [Amycolatopsis sp. WQ 127309]